MKLGIFGGTFNPVHYGHLRAAEEVCGKLSLDKVLFIPAGKTPFEKPETVSAVHRFNMVKTAIKGNTRFQISDIEVKARGKSFTVDTMKKLGKLYPGSELFFILGIDAFLDLPHWKQPDTLLNLSHCVVTSRPGYTFTDLMPSPYLRHVSRAVLRKMDAGSMDLFCFDISESQKCFLCRVTSLNISASYIRNLIISGENIKYLLPDSVESYIISHKLYKK
ncbi:MAG: nicotinate-nucleotide adenylyltransferase [Nitrospiraceae bacterium]|nr:MAG: nicotinate-nucleotide adenylyltransferase [Nitrospiraceae bacterium]